MSREQQIRDCISRLQSAGRRVALVADTRWPGAVYRMGGINCVPSSDRYVYPTPGARVGDGRYYTPDGSVSIPWEAVYAVIDADGPGVEADMRSWPRRALPSAATSAPAAATARALPRGWRVLPGGRASTTPTPPSPPTPPTPPSPPRCA